MMYSVVGLHKLWLGFQDSCSLWTGGWLVLNKVRIQDWLTLLPSRDHWDKLLVAAELLKWKLAVESISSKLPSGILYVFYAFLLS